MQKVPVHQALNINTESSEVKGEDFYRQTGVCSELAYLYVAMSKILYTTTMLNLHCVGLCDKVKMIHLVTYVAFSLLFYWSAVECYFYRHKEN
jgi:hypothetical protein